MPLFHGVVVKFGQEDITCIPITPKVGNFFRYKVYTPSALSICPIRCTRILEGQSLVCL